MEKDDEEKPQEASQSKEIYYLLETLPDEHTRLYVYWKTSEIIIVCQIFLVFYTIFYIYLSLTSKSNYYWIFFSIVPGLHFVSTLMVLFKRSGWSTQDIRALLKFNMSDMLSALTSQQTNFRPFTTFISIKVLLFFWAFGASMKPIFQYADYVAPPTNSSGCTKEYLRVTGNAYHPDGYFDYYLNYSATIQLKFCPMDQTYAYPNLYTYIVGYQSSPLGPEGSNACANPLPPFSNTFGINKVNGYADTNICLNRTTGKSASYLSPVLGVNPPITSGSQFATTILCKSNTDTNVCISPDGKTAYNQGTCPTLYRTGKPRKICPVCLNYWRRMSQDINGPPGYEHCSPYNPSAYDNPFCWFCSGRGYGFFAQERYDQEQLYTNLWMSVTITGMLLVEYLTCIILVSKFIPDISSNLEQT